MQARNRTPLNTLRLSRPRRLRAFATGGVLLFAVAFAGQGVNAQPGGDQKYLPQGVLDYGEVESREAVADFGGLHPALRRMSVPESEFEVDAAAGGVVTGSRGTRLSIPPQAFVRKNGAPVKGRVRIVLREVIDAFDFAIAPVGLEYTENGRREWFQSGGMFHVSATKGGEELILAPDQKIVVHFPNVASGDFEIFRTNDAGQWVRRGKSARVVAAGDPGEVAAAGGDDVNPESGEGGFEEMGVVGAHIFAIDGMTWWNFDKAYPHVACVKGAINDPAGVFSGEFQVFSIGLDYRGAFSRWSRGTEFKINVHKSRTAKLLIIDSKGNVGVSAALSTPRRSGFDQDPEGPKNFCQSVDSIEIREISEDLLKDREAFMRFLGLPEDNYGVNYGEPAG